MTATTTTTSLSLLLLLRLRFLSRLDKRWFDVECDSRFGDRLKQVLRAVHVLFTLETLALDLVAGLALGFLGGAFFAA